MSGLFLNMPALFLFPVKPIKVPVLIQYTEWKIYSFLSYKCKITIRTHLRSSLLSLSELISSINTKLRLSVPDQKILQSENESTEINILPMLSERKLYLSIYPFLFLICNPIHKHVANAADTH
jgi:hypothetical protein